MVTFFLYIQQERSWSRFFGIRKVFWWLNYLLKGQTVNAEYYSNLLCRLKEALKEKRRARLRKGVLFLQDNAPPHKAGKTMDVLKNLGFQCIDHPPYSPDLAPSDYFLFPNLKKALKGRKLSNDKSSRAVFQWPDIRILFGPFGPLKETRETMCQVCWTSGWICGIACKFHGSSSFPSWSGREIFSTPS